MKRNLSRTISVSVLLLFISVIGVVQLIQQVASLPDGPITFTLTLPGQTTTIPGTTVTVSNNGTSLTEVVVPPTVVVLPGSATTTVVTPPQRIKLTPSYALLGSSVLVTIEGSYFTGTTPCSLSSSNPAGLMIGSASCMITSGTLTASFTALALIIGQYNVTVSTLSQSATYPFVILPSTTATSLTTTAATSYATTTSTLTTISTKYTGTTTTESHTVITQTAYVTTSVNTLGYVYVTYTSWVAVTGPTSTRYTTETTTSTSTVPITSGTFWATLSQTQTFTNYMTSTSLFLVTQSVCSPNYLMDVNGNCIPEQGPQPTGLPLILGVDPYLVLAGAGVVCVFGALLIFRFTGNWPPRLRGGFGSGRKRPPPSVGASNPIGNPVASSFFMGLPRPAEPSATGNPTSKSASATIANVRETLTPSESKIKCQSCGTWNEPSKKNCRICRIDLSLSEGKTGSRMEQENALKGLGGIQF